MARVNVAQTSFAAGELSPHLQDRIDLEAYSAGCAELENFIPLPHGPLLRRRGSRFVYSSLSSTVRLVPFTFNVTQSFVIEFTPLKVRIFYKDGIIQAPGGAVLEVTTPYRAIDIPNINWAQFGDWLYIVDGYHQPQALKRYANNDWRLEPIVFTNKPTEWTGTNWPKVIVLFEQRAYYMATPAQPQQIWASRIGLYEDFKYEDTGGSDPIVLDDHAFTYTVFSNDVNGIQWALPMSALIIGTSGGEFKVSSSSSLDPITPKNVQVTAQTAYGSAPIRPIRIGTSVIFAQRSRNRIRSFEYSFSEDQYSAQDLTIYASHILQGRVKEMSVQTAPDSYILCITDAGELIGCTYEKAQRILAWHRHVTDGKFLSLSVLPTDGADIIYVAVQRQANGGTHTYIEIFEDTWETTTDITQAQYSDSCLKYASSTPFTNVSGLQHLNGKEVQILCEGWIHPPQVVVNGQVNLQVAVKSVTIGLGYTSYFMSNIPQGQDILTMGMQRRLISIIVAVEDSLDFKYRVIDEKENADARMYVAYNGPTQNMNLAKVVSSRHEDLVLNSATGKMCKIYIQQDTQGPLIVRAIVYFMDVNYV